MAIGTSGTLTQEFVSLLSAELLLAPDPQYVFAALAAASRAGAMEIPDVEGRSGDGANVGDAMFQGMGSVDRMSAVGSGFCKVVLDPTTPGKTILIDRPAYLGGTMTLASRTLTEGTRIGSTPIAPTMGQVSMTVVETSGPHDGSAVAPVAITDFLKRRARHDLIAYVGGLLRRDRNAFTDRVIVDLLLSTTNQTIGNGGAGGGTTGGMTAGGNKLKEADLAIVKRKLLERNIPTFANGRYILVIGPRHEEDLRADSTFREVVRYQVSAGPLISGYLTTYGGFDVCISNAIPTLAVGAGDAVTGYQAVAFGPQAVGHGIGMNAEARRGKDDDYGREDRMVWLAHEAFGLLNAAFVEKIVTS